MRKLLTLLFILLPGLLTAQDNSRRDSIIESLLKDQVTPAGDKGISLIKSGDFNAANTFLTNEISKDESNRAAYFKRGVMNWAKSDTLNACRDWSAVLALGDTEMFNFLDGQCHGSMIISNDTIPSKQYHKMWAKSGDSKTSANQQAKTVVEVMPSFPGGDQKLLEYLMSNIRQPKNKIRGTVYVNFLISPKGKILFPYVTRGLGGEHDKEALRLIRSMPAWNPGKQKGKAVYVRNNLPVRF
jgi:hypothetical protein